MSKAFHIDFKQIEREVKVLDLLSDSTCLLVVRELVVCGPLNVLELSAALSVSQHAISQYLQRLYAFKLISCERKNQQIYCKVKDNKIIDIIKVLGLLD